MPCYVWSSDQELGFGSFFFFSHFKLETAELAHMHVLNITGFFFKWVTAEFKCMLVYKTRVFSGASFRLINRFSSYQQPHVS